MKGVEGVKGVKGVEGGKGIGIFWNHMLLGGGRGGREGDQLSLTEKVL